jgi:hypothetical protein
LLASGLSSNFGGEDQEFEETIADFVGGDGVAVRFEDGGTVEGAGQKS